MFHFLRKNKIVIIVVSTDLFLYWLLFYSGVVLPLINPSVDQYKKMVIMGTSFPRNTNQALIWIYLHFPTSYIIGSRSDKFLFLSVVQTGIITYCLEKFIQRKKISLSPDEYVTGILAGNRIILSRAITLIESSLPKHIKLAQKIIERCIPYSGNSVRIGITGVPGVGKSTFIESFG